MEKKNKQKTTTSTNTSTKPATRVFDRTEQDKKLIINRISRITGQLDGIKKMIADNRSCDDIFIQLLAGYNSIKSLANLIIEKDMYNYAIDKIKKGDNSVLDEIATLYKRFQ